MRTRILAAGLLVLAVAAGCARGHDTGGTGVASATGAKATPSAAATEDPDAPLKFSQCMREHGMTWFPDPRSGKLSVTIPPGTDKDKFDAAQTACKQWAPDNVAKRPIDPAMLDQLRRMAQCMRENGVPKFPDPGADGSIQLDGRKIGMGPGDPAFDKAQAKCQSIAGLPAGGDTHSQAG